jgi:hypothetical protein
LVYAFGLKKPPLCIPCAVVAAGIRSNAAPPVLDARQRKQLRKERRSAARRGHRVGLSTPQLEALPDDDLSLIASISTTSSAAFTAPSTATVATGIPLGICTVEYSASTPLSAPPDKGTPTTGKVVWAATTPARWAAIPAAAMIAT